MPAMTVRLIGPADRTAAGLCGQEHVALVNADPVVLLEHVFALVLGLCLVPLGRPSGAPLAHALGLVSGYARHAAHLPASGGILRDRCGAVLARARVGGAGLGLAAGVPGGRVVPA